MLTKCDGEGTQLHLKTHCGVPRDMRTNKERVQPTLIKATSVTTCTEIMLRPNGENAN